MDTASRWPTCTRIDALQDAVPRPTIYTVPHKDADNVGWSSGKGVVWINNFSVLSYAHWLITLFPVTE